MADPTVQVTWEDQQKINQFGILNNRRHELEESHKELKVRFFFSQPIVLCVFFFVLLCERNRLGAGFAFVLLRRVSLHHSTAALLRCGNIAQDGLQRATMNRGSKTVGLDQTSINPNKQLFYFTQKYGFKTTQPQEKHLQLEEASEEMILADDGAPVMYRIGDSFLYLAKDTVEARIERDQAAVAARLAATQGELADTEDTLQGLKKALYGKFGDSINLEER
jgi:prefoldin subunit 4